MTAPPPGAEHGLKTQLVVGLEIHVELATRSKMFTRAPNVAHPDHYDAPPNSLTDPIVLGMPGVLPVINKQAVEMAMRVGLALGCKVARFTKWDRKSYYYPDLPKNYQISQYDLPLCTEGALEVPVSNEFGTELHTVRIIRAHLEEDAGKLLHEAPGGVPIDYSIVDLNRAGTPLLEVVTYPDLHSPDQAVAICQALRDICRHLGVSEGIMERGQIRFEPNINVIIEKDGEEYRTPIVEIKNLNSFKAVYGSVQYEYHRQVDQWIDTHLTMDTGTKSTRGWDDDRGVTVLQREKEEAHDYRYFPDPDLVPLTVDEEWVESLRAGMVELPWQRQRRYVDELGLNPKNARRLIEDPEECQYFEEILATGADAKRAASLVLNNLARRANQAGMRIHQLQVAPVQVWQIIQLGSSNKISSTSTDALIDYCVTSDEPADQLAEKHGLLQVSDTDVLATFVDQVLADPKNKKAIDDIIAGKDKVIGALVGQIMKLSKGQANPKLVGEMIKQKLQA